MPETTGSEPLRRCQIDDCREPARYVARVDWTNQPALYLCMEHAGEERKWDSVYSIAGLMLDRGDKDA